METEKDPMLINVEKVLYVKNPTLARWMPRFVVRYLKRIVHQDGINDIIKNHGHLRGSAFNDGALSYMGIKYRAHGLENLPLGRTEYLRLKPPSRRSRRDGFHERAFQALQRNKIPRQ